MRRARSRSPLLVPLLAAVAMLTFAPGAAAHDVLTGSSPAEGETLSESPSEVALTFSNELLDGNNVVEVSPSGGEPVVEGAPSLDGDTATLELPEALDGGEYTVTWSVVSSDGHRVEGEYAFTVEAGAGEATTVPGGTETTGEPDQAGTPVPTADSAEEERDRNPVDMPAWAAIAVAIAIAVGLVAMIVRLMRRR
ncbi:copper resistance CopC family protein [Georgenia alba]|uniref:Copper resistance protein CopC n=1 Tax=Georgenia alba TaxID=2233858 RepID=A0ABW2Q7R6_9MICO